MGYTQIDALRISPKYSAPDWQALDPTNPDDWRSACEIVKDRLVGRFLQYASDCLKSPNSGFVVLAIDSLLLETIQQFREGVIDGRGQSKRLVREFLKGQHFQPEFEDSARLAYYEDIRCGLLHQAEAKRMWLIRRDQDALLAPFPNGDGYIIDVQIFHKRLSMSLDDYLQDIQTHTNHDLRKNLWHKMNDICNVRQQRGAIDATAVQG
jgi:hypothetical protein